MEVSVMMLLVILLQPIRAAVEERSLLEAEAQQVKEQTLILVMSSRMRPTMEVLEDVLPRHGTGQMLVLLFLEP